jgi:uncharacterized protein YjbJ (UPF0337 family)
MNIDTVAGEATQLKGRFKESFGDAVGDSALRSDGVADQVSGGVRKSFGALRDFARDRPFATAAALAVGLAVLARSRRTGTGGR